MPDCTEFYSDRHHLHQISVHGPEVSGTPVRRSCNHLPAQPTLRPTLAVQECACEAPATIKDVPYRFVSICIAG